MSQQDQNKEVVRRLIEHGIHDMKTNPAAAHEYFAEHYREHTPTHHERNDLQGFKEVMADVHDASPDVQMKVLDQAADGDLVFTHWEASGTHGKAHQKHSTLKGVQPTGEQEQISGVFIHRLQNGKIVESWTYDNSHQIVMKGQGAARA